MKYSLRKSFSYRRRVELDDEHTGPRLDANGCSNSNSNLVKSKKKTTNFLQRRRRFSSSPPPPSPPPTVPEQSKSKSKGSEPRYNNHINIDDENDDEDDPFTSSTTANRVRPIDRLTYRLRKSFRGTLTRQRSRLESNNSNKRLLFNRNDSNPPVSPSTVPPMSTGLSSQFITPAEPVANEANQTKAPAKRRKAPLAPSHMHQSASVPNPETSALKINDNPESGYVSSSNEQEKSSLMKKNKFNQSFRTRISLLLKKRHEKRQQTHTSLDEESDQPPHDDAEELDGKKITLSQRFDTLRRSLHLGKRHSTGKGKGHLLLNE